MSFQDDESEHAETSPTPPAAAATATEPPATCDNNFDQTYEKCVVRNALRKELEKSVRGEVEQLMTLELEALHAVLDKKGKGKGKKGKGKKDKKKGKKDKKKDKDLTANRTMESLEEELTKAGIMTIPPKIEFSEITGSYQILPTHITANGVSTPSCIKDLVNLLVMYATMPMIDSEVTENLQNRVRSILLAGPCGSGKRNLAYATAHEMRAVMFDLSCDNLIGKYPGKQGQAMLLHMIFKVAKVNQPAVIFINDADSMFFKKVPKEIAHLDPKRLKKDWPKIMKKFPSTDRILVLGTASQPFNADPKGLCKIWDKILLVPRPDYGTRLEVWRTAIQKYSSPHVKTGLECDNTVDSVGQVSKDTAVDLGSLARISEGFTSEQIHAIARQTLKTLESVLQTRTLKVNDFLTNMSKLEPISEEMEEDFFAWYAKTPLGKRFQALSKTDDDGEGGGNDKKGGDKKKKGK